jgi:hypothetical protein
MNKISWGGNHYDVPEYVNFSGNRYNEMASYTPFRDTARKWAKDGTTKDRIIIVRVFPSNEYIKRVGHKKLYVLYKRYVERVRK